VFNAAHLLDGLPLFLLAAAGLAGVVFSARGVLRRWT
jgi:hypothetical protein